MVITQTVYPVASIYNLYVVLKAVTHLARVQDYVT